MSDSLSTNVQLCTVHAPHFKFDPACPSCQRSRGEQPTSNLCDDETINRVVCGVGSAKEGERVRAYIERLREQDEAAKHDIEQLLQSVTGEANEAQRLRAALQHAVSIIQIWHNMELPLKERSKLWDIYWRNAPEMKRIQEALGGADEVVSETSEEKP